MAKVKRMSRKQKQLVTWLSVGGAVLLTALGFVLYLFSLPTYQYTILDNNRIKKIRSDFREPAKVLQEAGIPIGSHDRFYMEGNQLTVERAMTVTVTTEKGILTAYSFGETVGQLLDRLQIPEWQSKKLSHSADTTVFDKMELFVEHTETIAESVVRDLQYGTRYCYDPTMEAGKEELLFYGIPGKQETFTDAVYVNGSLESMTVKENVLLTDPVDQIVAIGTGEKVGEKRQYPLVGDDFLVTADLKCLFFSSVDVYNATAYTSGIADVGYTTACGTPARVGAVAVDPKVIPYFTKMYIVSQDGVFDYGQASAEDCGGAVKGKIIDLYFNTLEDCYAFGRRDIMVYFLTDGQVGEPVIKTE